LNDQSDQLAKSLKKSGVVNGSIVGIAAENSIEVTIAIIGILKAGAAYLPIDPTYPAERKRYILEDSGASLLLTHNRLTGHLNWQGSMMNLEELLTEPIHHPHPANMTGMPANLAYVIYTSGSTGRPKGVMIEHQGLVNYIWWAAGKYVRNRKVNFPFYSSLSFDLTVTSIFTPLITGNTIIVYGSEDKGALIEKIIDDNQVGVIKLTPSHLRLIRENEKDSSNSNIKTFIVGGEELETSLARDISKSFHEDIEIYNEYGPTEAVVGCMCSKFNPTVDNQQAVSIGIPINNVHIYLLDKNRRPLPPGVTGEICVSGDGLARGYLNQPELTMEKFAANPFSPGKQMYLTGDLARFSRNGNIEFKGRIDQQSKINGIRIELGEIANTLLEHEEIKEAVVMAHEKNGSFEGRGYYLCAYSVPAGEISELELREYLAQKLPQYMIPSHFILLEKIPLTANGKVDYQALPIPEGNRPHLKAAYVAPKSDQEKIVADIWKQTLQLEKIGIHDNVFDLGGSSLDIIKINNKLREIFDRDISVEDMFRYPTIDSFLNYLSRETDEQGIEDIVALRSQKREKGLERKRQRYNRKKRSI
jgi:amino acid adenylation domain-containing protein